MSAVFWTYWVILPDDLCIFDEPPRLRAERYRRGATTSFGILHVSVWEDAETLTMHGKYRGCCIGLWISDQIPDFPGKIIGRISLSIEEAMPEALKYVQGWLDRARGWIATEAPEAARPREG